MGALVQLGDDVLSYVFYYVISITDRIMLMTTCSYIRVLCKTPFVLADKIEDIFGFDMYTNVRCLLVKHIVMCSHIHLMTHVCDHFIVEYQMKKCARVHNSYIPLNRALIDYVYPIFNDLRNCSKWWLLGRMVIKLMKSLKHELIEICDSQYQVDAIVFSMYVLYTRLSTNVNVDIELDFAYISKYLESSYVNSIDAFITNYIKENLRFAWVPTLEDENCLIYTKHDKIILQSIVHIVAKCVGEFGRNMQVCTLYKWHQYRRDISFSQKCIHHLQMACEN